MEEKPVSVAALASKFNHKTSDTLEKDEKCPRGPIRKKPPCSLPLHGNKSNVKTETDHNGDEKPPINEASRPSKLKLKNSSPLIEKLQATLLLSPTALVPGVGPKSPLKSSFSPFASPASTPESPGMHSLSSESDGSVVTIDQPREAEPLQSLHKNRARLSMKRRPPSRRFRRSATDDVVNTGSPETEQSDNSAKEVEPKQKGAAEEGNDEVFTNQVQIDNGDAHPSAEGEARSSPRSSAEGEAHSSPRSSAEGEAHSSPRSSAEGEAHSSPRSSAEGEAHSSPRSSAEGEAHSSPRSSAEGEAHSSPRSSTDLSPGEPAQMVPSDPLSSQSQESETCTANQDEHAEDNNIASKMILESADKDNESTDNIIHNPAGSETVVIEMSNQELKTEEVKATDSEQRIVNAEEKPSEALE